jgi:hypothetical protein
MKYKSVCCSHAESQSSRRKQVRGDPSAPTPHFAAKDTEIGESGQDNTVRRSKVVPATQPPPTHVLCPSPTGLTVPDKSVCDI